MAYQRTLNMLNYGFQDVSIQWSDLTCDVLLVVKDRDKAYVKLVVTPSHPTALFSHDQVTAKIVFDSQSVGSITKYLTLQGFNSSGGQTEQLLLNNCYPRDLNDATFKITLSMTSEDEEGSEYNGNSGQQTWSIPEYQEFHEFNYFAIINNSEILGVTEKLSDSSEYVLQVENGKYISYSLFSKYDLLNSRTFSIGEDYINISIRGDSNSNFTHFSIDTRALTSDYKSITQSYNYNSGLNLTFIKYSFSKPVLNVSSSVTYNNAPSISWTNVSGNYGYQLQRSITSDFSSPTEVTITNTTSYNSDVLGTWFVTKTVYYRVRETSQSGGLTGGWSDPKSTVVNGILNLISDGSSFWSKPLTSWSEGISPKPSKSGYTFAGWYTAVSNGERKTIWAPTENEPQRTLYAHWDVSGYIISYNTKGAGTITPSQATYNSSDGKYHFTVTTQKPTIQGKSFVGWSSMEDSEQATYYSGQSYTTTSNLTLFAVYNSDKTITYNKRDGEKGAPPAAQTVKYNDSITLDNGDWLTKTGYNLQHWQAGDGTGPTYALGATYSEPNSLNLYGSWTPKNITITWKTAKNGPTSAPYPAGTYPTSLPFGTTFILPSLPTLTGEEVEQFSPKEWLVNGITHSIGSSFTISQESAYTIQGVYKKNTSWRGCFGERGGLWIYIGDDN